MAYFTPLFMLPEHKTVDIRCLKRTKFMVLICCPFCLHQTFLRLDCSLALFSVIFHVRLYNILTSTSGASAFETYLQAFPSIRRLATFNFNPYSCRLRLRPYCLQKVDNTASSRRYIPGSVLQRMCKNGWGRYFQLDTENRHGLCRHLNHKSRKPKRSV